MGDHSQFGEYLSILRPYIERNVVRHRIVVDIGAYGKEHSNSFNLIADHDFRVLMVEPDPCNIIRIEEEYHNNWGRIALAKCAVSTVPGVMPLYFYEDSKESSLVPPDGTRFSTGSTMVTTMTVDNVLRVHNIPFDFDILSIDVNGLDGAIVLSLLDSPFRPGLILYDEASVPQAARSSVHAALKSAGYEKCFESERNAAWERGV